MPRLTQRHELLGRKIEWKVEGYERRFDAQKGVKEEMNLGRNLAQGVSVFPSGKCQSTGLSASRQVKGTIKEGQT